MWSTLVAILSLIRVYTFSHSQHSDQGLHYLPFSKVWSGCTLSEILICLIWVYTICLSQSDQGLHDLPFSAVWSQSTLFAFLSKQYYQGIHCLPCSGVYSGSILLPFSAVWSRSRCTMSFSVWLGSTLFAILSILINIYTICHSQQSDQGLHYLTFSAVWSRSTLFAILSSLISVYIICNFQQSDQGLRCLPFSAVWSGSSLFAIFTLMKV